MNRELIKRWATLILILVVGLLVVRTCMRKMHPSVTVMHEMNYKAANVITSCVTIVDYESNLTLEVGLTFRSV